MRLRTEEHVVPHCGKLYCPQKNIYIPRQEMGSLGGCLFEQEEHAEIVLFRENSDCDFQSDLRHKGQKLWDRY